MPSDNHALGLRERKKIKTREAIRREAFRLFDANGYAATTVEQIADDLDPLILAAFEAQPPELSPIEAIRRAYETTMAGLSPEQLEFENTRQRLMFSIPELKAAMYDEYYRTVNVMAELIGRRIDRPADDFEVRVFVGALTGAMMAAYDSAPKTADTIYRALDFVDAGMPLG